jgi:hypothetical protein
MKMGIPPSGGDGEVEWFFDPAHFHNRLSETTRFGKSTSRRREPLVYDHANASATTHPQEILELAGSENAQGSGFGKVRLISRAQQDRAARHGLDPAQHIAEGSN